MPEARERLSSKEGILATYSNRGRILGTGSRNVGRGNSVIFILEKEADEVQATGTPLRWRGIAMVTTPGPMGLASGRGSIGTPRMGHAANFRRSSARIIGRDNLSPIVGSGRGRGVGKGRGNSGLPYWYPRKPLQDITAVMRAIERRRARWGKGDGLQHESPILHDRMVDDSSISSGVQHEHVLSVVSPDPGIGKVTKILLNITNQDDGDSTCVKPQKKLLDNFDKVEKVLMEELVKLKRTPVAKKAEREKRVRTLMSMR